MQDSRTPRLATGEDGLQHRFVWIGDQQDRKPPATGQLQIKKGRTLAVAQRPHLTGFQRGGGVFGDVILDTARRQRSRALPLRPKGHHRAKVAIGCAHDLRDHSQNAAGFAQAS